MHAEKKKTPGRLILAEIPGSLHDYNTRVYAYRESFDKTSIPEPIKDRQYSVNAALLLFDCERFN